MKNGLLLTLLLLSLKTLGQEIPAKSESYQTKTFALGILGNHKVLGVQAEYRFAKRFGLKMIGTKVLDIERKNEFAYAGIALLTYYIPTNSQLVEPIITLGGVYSVYHWNLAYNTGNIHDFNVGGGFGTNFRVSNTFRTGVNIFLANNFRTEYADRSMSITGRKLLILPTLTFEMLF